MAGKKLLLVEGNDDFHVVLAIQGQRGIRVLDKREIIPHDGVDGLITAFPVHLKGSDIRVLGVVVDADTDVHGRWQSLRDRLIEAGYGQVPNDPNNQGTVIEPPAGTLLPRVGVWLMPDNTTTGILENFLSFLVPQGNELFEHAKNSISTIPQEQRRFSSLAEPKALIHTWLAWQEEPGRPLGQSITARFLNHDVPEVDLFVGWLQRLYA